MRAAARYDFERKDNCVSVYTLKSQEGTDIKNFLPEDSNGNKYIEFMRNEQGARFYEYGFYLGIQGGRHKRLTGVNFTKTEKCRTFGDSRNIGRNDCLLFEFSEDFKNLTVWFLEDKANKSRWIFEAWCNGDFVLMPKKKALVRL